MPRDTSESEDTVQQYRDLFDTNILWKLKKRSLKHILDENKLTLSNSFGRIPRSEADTIDAIAHCLDQIESKSHDLFLAANEEQLHSVLSEREAQFVAEVHRRIEGNLDPVLPPGNPPSIEKLLAGLMQSLKSLDALQPEFDSFKAEVENLAETAAQKVRID